MRKILLLFSALLLSATAMAYDFKVDGLCYAINEGFAEVTAEADFNNNYPDLVKAVIPNYVEYDNVQYRVLGLGENAFNGAKNLESIEFPSYDGGYEFYIKSFAAANCPKLKNVDLVGVSEIGDVAFAGAALESIRIWWGIEKIGNQIFMGCKNLTEIKVDENNEYYDSRDNCNAIVETKTNTLIMGCNASTIPNTVTTIGRYAFQDCENLAVEHLPTSVVKVGANAFDYTPLYPLDKEPAEGAHYIDHILYKYYSTDYDTPKELVVKEGTLGIAEYACAGIKFSSLTLPSSLKCISAGAFTDTQLSQLSLPASVERIEEYAFSNSALTNVTIPENVKYVGKGAFEGNSFTSITWNAIDCETEIVEGGSIWSSVFGGLYSLKSFTFGNTVKTIPNSLCGGLGYDIEEGIEITLPNSVEKIGHRAFDGSGIKTITIPENVKSIEKNAFGSCYNLSQVTLGGNEDSIHPEAFRGTPWWNSYYENLSDGPIYLGKSLIGYKGEMPENTTLVVKEGTTAIADYVFNYENRPENLVAITFPESLEEIGNNSFRDCVNLKEVTIPKAVTKVGEYAFDARYLEKVTWNAVNCESLKENEWENSIHIFGDSFEENSISRFILGTEVERIPNYLCYGMTNVEEITLPSTLKSVGESAFMNCSIKEIIIPENVDSIYSNAFRGCKISEVTIPEGVTYVGGGAFYDIDLTNVTWNAINASTNIEVTEENPGTSSWSDGESIFSGACDIKSFIFGNKVKNIPAGLCRYLSIQSLVIPEGVETIGSEALRLDNCPLTEINIPASVKSLGDNAIRWSNLEKYIVDEDNTVYASQDGILYIKDFTKIVEVPYNIKGEINIPAVTENVMDFKEWWNDNPLTAINIEEGHKELSSEDGVVFNNDKTILYRYPIMKTGDKYSIPNTVLTIDTMAFAFNPYLKEIEMSDNVNKLGVVAFMEMYSLEEVQLSSSLKTIPHAAFAFCENLQQIVIPEGVEEIGTSAFIYCENLSMAIIPSTVKRIGAEAFAMEGTNLHNVYSYATTPPELWWINNDDDDWGESGEEYIFTNFNANLHVPASALEDYKFHPMYQDFKYIMAMGVVTEPTTDVTIKPSDDNALFTWPVVDKAVSYTLEITFEGELFCTLDFNAYGQLTALNFKRSADATPAAGFQFTVTGLEGNTEYGYTLEAKDSENKVLDTYTGTFTTGTPTAVEEVSDASISVSDGTISCDADFSIYNTTGQNVTSLNGSLQSGIYVVTIGEDKVKVMVK